MLMVDTPKKRKKKISNKKTLTWISAVLIVAIIAGIAVCVIKSAAENRETSSERAERISKQNAEFATRSLNGEVESGEVQDILASDLSDAEKAEQLNSYVTYAALQEDTDDEGRRNIMNVAIKAYELDNIANLLWIITDIAEELGDTETQKKYKPILDAQLAEYQAADKQNLGSDENEG